MCVLEKKRFKFVYTIFWWITQSIIFSTFPYGISHIPHLGICLFQRCEKDFFLFHHSFPWWWVSTWFLPYLSWDESKNYKKLTFISSRGNRKHKQQYWFERNGLVITPNKRSYSSSSTLKLKGFPFWVIILQYHQTLESARKYDSATSNRQSDYPSKFLDLSTF